MSKEEVDLVRLAVEGMRRGWSIRIAQAGIDQGRLAPDVELIPARVFPDGEPSYRGAEGIDEFMRAWTEDFEDWSMELDRVIDAGDGRIVSLVRQSGTGRASGVPVELSQGIVWEVSDGRIIRMRIYADPADALEAAGVSE